MKNLKYDMIGASMSGENSHPQTNMETLGIKYFHATPQSISDSWWFWACEYDESLDLPSYINELNVDPMECIGWGLNEETAIDIRSKINKDVLD